MDEEHDDAAVALTFLKQHINDLSPTVCAIHLSAEGAISEELTEFKGTVPAGTWYPRLQDLQIMPKVKATSRSDLHECQRLTPNVDLVSYGASEAECATKLVVFKYYFLNQFLYKTWHEMNLLARLPAHPNLVSFDSLVYDEPSDLLVGFTTVYLPGGTINKDTSRDFKLAWLKQLTHVIDDLNFRFGIMHQDAAPRNLLSGRIGHTWFCAERDDVKGVIFTLYEIITRDEQHRMVPHTEQDPHAVKELEEWVQHPEVRLDQDVAEYQAVLNGWVKQRREGKQTSMYTDGLEPIDWPEPNIVWEDCISLPWVRPAPSSSAQEIEPRSRVLRTSQGSTSSDSSS
ncbi:hypothetical protein LTR78_001368 [Recurvomyces mirabilis]|uniref:Protein kinase domain-containing protein n=1 Tax=Recurvomyces mirabilis TaxID=574656 RepID=A0AAE1C5L9_9PEZI|nr:hypothetical protein LTR78_001368 [Recurvomyces mirabilis]KAK5161345.1 hypothetical protein LTS14_001141 [Recurvomyces mirabilis]